jgi:hypothetical protein
MKSMFLGALLAASTLAAHAGELTLFGKQLNATSRTEIEAAAKASGAQLTSSNETTDVFDPAALGLPGTTSFEVVFLNDHVVMAQYTLDKSTLATDERFRKMLIAKYGFPQHVDDDTPTQQFADEFTSATKFRWQFAGNMELVFTKEFFGDRYLTYVNKSLQARMQHMLDSDDQKGAAKAAKAKQDLF